mgnify:CR=1 FL=1
MNDVLHIITPLYRFEFLKPIYQSLPNSNNIIWHISKSKEREDILDEVILKDTRVKIYNVDCNDNEPYKKRIQVLNNITSGYFCFIDDDTILHPNMYQIFEQKSSVNFIGMIIGQQIDKSNKIRLQPNIPKYTKIDTGNVLSHTDCLKKVQWPLTYTKGKSQRDSIFWTDVYEYFNKQCILLTEPISYYNKLR